MDSALSPEQVQRLRDLCCSSECKNRSYSPYSQFKVGCALLLEDGSHILGANIENATYGATLCAERVAIAKYLTEGQEDRAIVAMGVSGSCADTITTPCGICRQVIAEFSQFQNVPIYMFNSSGTKHTVQTIHDLLPASFQLQH